MEVVNNSKKGTLYIVATPIGNLEDITFRAVRILKEVGFVLAEDTRYTAKLLKHYEIKTQAISYRDQNHNAMIDKIYEKLDIGMNLALVSDNGTPLISDPGYKLVRELREKGYRVETVPGPSALTAAASISGLPTDRLLFLGFTSKSDVRQGKSLRLANTNKATLVIYESPKRLIRLLENIDHELGSDRMVSVVSEMTKKFEKVQFGEVQDVLDHFYRVTPKGEFVVLVAKGLEKEKEKEKKKEELAS
jgi:16S rRNA (cytidine1402-2'-O)-methyltransferase